VEGFTLETNELVVADLCKGVVVTEKAPFPAAKGDPGIGVRVPVLASMLYPETSPPLPLKGLP
jgi:hypothetical protein